MASHPALQRPAMMTYRFPLIVDVSKRKDWCYRSGRSSDWLKSKSPTCAAVKRGADED